MEHLPQFAQKRRTAAEIGVSLTTLRRCRDNGTFTKGVHWVEFPPRIVLYNLPLLVDWVANRETPELHQAAIDAYLTSLPSSQAVAAKGRKTQKAS